MRALGGVGGRRRVSGAGGGVRLSVRALPAVGLLRRSHAVEGATAVPVGELCELRRHCFFRDLCRSDGTGFSPAVKGQ